MSVIKLSDSEGPGVPGSEVILHKEDDRLIVEPVARPRTLAEILPGLTPLTEDFPEFTDSPAQPEAIL